MPLPSHIRKMESLLDGAPLGEGGPLVAAILAGRWGEVPAQAEKLLEQASSDEERAFAIFCAAGAAEMLADYAARQRWLQRWDEVARPESNLYCKYVRLYQNGITAFFSAYLGEAEAHFVAAAEVARALSFPNGLMRSLYHLGLARRDKGDFAAAQEYFRQAGEIAVSLDARRYLQRIAEQLDALAGRSPEGEKSVIGAAIETERLLLAGQPEEARRALAAGERTRRRQGLGRKVASLYAYLPLVQFSRKRERLGRNSLRWITDPVLMARVLELKGRMMGLSLAEAERLKGYRLSLALSAPPRSLPLDPRDLVVCGKRLAEIPDPAVQALLLAFLEERERALSKEEICWAVWKLRYDPLRHDGRVYKLIHRARSHFRGKEIFLNTYGGYRLRPEVLAGNPGEAV